MTAREILIDIAEELEQHPERWCQGASARDADGSVVSSASKQAVCWCLDSLLYLRAQGKQYVEVSDLVRRHIAHTYVAWNDAPERTVGDVIAACRKAAEVCR